MRQYRDFYFKKAKEENFPARSIYKLQEIDKRYHMLKQGWKVLDLGASPGSWSLEAAKKVGKSGVVVACDIQDLNITRPENLFFYQNDIFNPGEEFTGSLQKFAPFNLVMSDMAPSTTGSKFTDQARSLDLGMRAFDMAKSWLMDGGNFIVKIFMGPDVKELLAPMRAFFENVCSFKPKSSRPESKETFFIGLKYKNHNNMNNVKTDLEG